MIYVFILLGFIVIAFLFLYKFRIAIYNKDNYLHIEISKFITLRLNLFVLLDNDHKEERKKQSKGLKYFNKIEIKEIDLKLQGLNFDYRLNGGYYGLLHALFGFTYSVCKQNDIIFNYDLKYKGDKSIEFRAISRSTIPIIVALFYGMA